jgi:hypothetical protein
MFEQFKRFSLRIDLIEYLIPSNEMLLEVLKTLLPTEADIYALINLSNQWVEQIPQYFGSSEIAEEQSVWRSICIRLGMSYNALFLHQLKELWYDCLHMHRSGHQRRYQAISDFLASVEGVYSGKKYPDNKFWEWQAKLNKNNPLTQFIEYQKACEQVDRVLHSVANAAKSDRISELQLLLLLNLRKDRSYRAHRLGQTNEISWTLCRRCGTLFSYSSSKLPADCGNSVCKKRTQALKPSKQKRGLAAQGWISTGKRGDCCSCGEKRVLDLNQVCKECFLE